MRPSPVYVLFCISFFITTGLIARNKVTVFGLTENARVENAGLENAGKDSVCNTVHCLFLLSPAARTE